MAMMTGTESIKKEEGLVEVSQKLRAEAETLFSFIEKALLNPPEKDQKECLHPMFTPFNEISANLHDTLVCLRKIRELVDAEVINKL